MIVERLVVGRFQENCYIIGDEASGMGALVDPGDDAVRIVFAVEQTGLVISRILVTHAHVDHVRAVAHLADEYSCPVLMHSEAAETLKTLPRQAIMMGVKLDKVPKVDGYIEDNEILEIGALRLRALYTPGHAPGHLAFYVEDEGLIFSGDTLFAGSIGRTDLPGGNMDLLMQSIFERLMALPDDTRVLSGHGPETTIAREQMTNPFLAGGSF